MTREEAQILYNRAIHALVHAEFACSDDGWHDLARRFEAARKKLQEGPALVVAPGQSTGEKT